jgi:hypothetical protein
MVLAVLVLQQIAARAVQDARATPLDRRRVLLGFDPVARGLVAEELHVRVVEEGVEDADRVRSAAHAGATASGSRPVSSSTCARASSPMIFWKSRTIAGTDAARPPCRRCSWWSRRS